MKLEHILFQLYHIGRHTDIYKAELSDLSSELKEIQQRSSTCSKKLKEKKREKAKVLKKFVKEEKSLKDLQRKCEKMVSAWSASALI